MMSIKRTVMTLTATGLLLAAHAEANKVYKTVDKDGNVVFTDQPPEPGAEPLEMRGLSIVEFQKSDPPKAVRATPDDLNEDGQVTDLRTLRRGYRDFRLVQPTSEQTFVGTENIATFAWETQYELQEGMNVVLAINGQRMPGTTQQVVASPRLDRGEHEVTAQLIDARGRVIASADPVTFFIRQNTVNNQRVARPLGGG